MEELMRDYLEGRLKPVKRAGVPMSTHQRIKEEEVMPEFSSESDSEEERMGSETSNHFFTETEDAPKGLTDIIIDEEEIAVESEGVIPTEPPSVFRTHTFTTNYKKELPIDSSKDTILDLINSSSVVIIQGQTGCGKTTQVPQYILDDCRVKNAPCNIVVTQPRRIAAVSVAQRVCEERGWALGTVCGYQIGLDKNVSDDVILTYVTTEVLLQKLIVTKNLNKYTHIIIDEVHERSKQLDFLLLLTRKYLFTNSSDVKIVLMSATMDVEKFAKYFRRISHGHPNDYLKAPVFKVLKTSDHVTEIFFYDYISQLIPHSIEFSISEPTIQPEQYELCLNLIKFFDKHDKELTKGDSQLGSVLVFLPGFHQIEELHNILSADKTPHMKWDIVPLHSTLSSEQITKVFRKTSPGIRKIILSTNIAESSVTVPDVTYVIDFCLTKVVTVNPVTKFSSLTLEWASLDNCTQRAGRVGRVSNGRVYRLVPEEFYEHELPKESTPEMKRAPLENVILYTKMLDIPDTPKKILSLAIDQPNLKEVETCLWHLKEIGALLQTCRGKKSSQDGDITFLGKVMGNLPIDIHLAKMIVLGHMYSCLEEMVIIAAGCSTRNLFVNTFHDRFACYRKKLQWSDSSFSDSVTLLNLYEVWFDSKRSGKFRSTNEEYAWCRTNYINLKGLREWELLIKEIHSRLKKFNIEKPVSVTRVTYTKSEKALVLRIIISGAFYPNYFIRSSDFGQIDSKQAIRVLNGRDPFKTVYFTNMKPGHPGKIYVRQLKKLLNADNTINFGFDEQSSKIFVEFKNVKRPEAVTSDGRKLMYTAPGKVAPGVYEAVKRFQLRMPFHLKILSDKQAWDFAAKVEEKLKNEKLSEEVNCFSSMNYSSLPSLDIQHISVQVSHVVDVGHFYCQNWDTDTINLLKAIDRVLNVSCILENVKDNITENDKFYAAIFREDRKFYRCRVLKVLPNRNRAQIQFIDYGNTQIVGLHELYELPNFPECFAPPIAMCSALSEVRPSLVLNPNAIWSERTIDNFKKKTLGFLLFAKIYSVVDDTVYMELYKSRTSTFSLNDWLVQENFAEKCEEGYLSQLDHEKRQKVLTSDNPSMLGKYYSSVEAITRYTDFEAPELGESNEVLELRGPFSPLEMRIIGLTRALSSATVHIEEDSVNCVLLDDSPEDPHARMVVAGHVSEGADGSRIKISQTTILPAVPGLAMIVTLLFCPTMEPKLSVDGSRVASVLCGLGYREFTQRALFPQHDISFILDTELKGDAIVKINELRYSMNNAIRVMNDIASGQNSFNELVSIQKFLKDKLFKLTSMQFTSVERLRVPYAHVWNKNASEDIEILRMGANEPEEDIWRLLWFVRLNHVSEELRAFKQNLDELLEIARGLKPPREITCKMCNSNPLLMTVDVRLHLIEESHKKKSLEVFKK